MPPLSCQVSGNGIVVDVRSNAQSCSCQFTWQVECHKALKHLRVALSTAVLAARSVL
jgi:hypothetical protein